MSCRWLVATIDSQQPQAGLSVNTQTTPNKLDSPSGRANTRKQLLRNTARRQPDVASSRRCSTRFGCGRAAPLTSEFRPWTLLLLLLNQTMFSQRPINRPLSIDGDHQWDANMVLCTSGLAIYRFLLKRPPIDNGAYFTNALLSLVYLVYCDKPAHL